MSWKSLIKLFVLIIECSKCNLMHPCVGLLSVYIVIVIYIAQNDDKFVEVSIGDNSPIFIQCITSR